MCSRFWRDIRGRRVIAVVGDLGRGSSVARSSEIMAPKAKPAAKKVAAPKAETLIQQMEVDASADKKRPSSKRARRDLDGQVEKLVKDNFKTWSSQAVDVVLRDGLTLRQTLARDKARNLRGELTMGKNYYAMMRKFFEDGESPGRKLKVSHKTDSENERLKEALFELTGHKSNLRPFVAFLDEDVVDNQRTVVAVLKAALDIKPDSGPKQANAVLEVMKWTIRNGVSKNFPAEVSICKDHFDLALTRSFVYMKKHDIGLDSWWAVHSEVLGLVVDPVAFEACLKCKSDWMDVAPQLNLVVSSSLVGQEVFGVAFRSLKHNRAQAVVDDLLAALRKEKVITAQTLKTYKNRYISELKKMQQDPFATFARKMTKVVYRKCSVEVPITSLVEQFTANCAAAVKTLAVEIGVLPSLFSEDDLVEEPEERVQITISPEVLVSYKEARSAAVKLMAGAEEYTGETITKALLTKRLVLQSLDQTFKVEEAFWVFMKSDAGERLLQSRLLDCLPDLDKPMAIDESHQAMQNLGRTSLLSFAGFGLAGMCKTLQAWLVAMKHGRAPDFGSAIEGDFMVTAVRRISLFARWPLQDAASSSSGPVVVTVYGKQAVDKVLDDVVAKGGEDPAANLNLADMRPLHVFAHLLSEVQKSQAATLTDAILSKVGIVVAAADSSQNMQPPKKVRKCQKSADTARRSVVAGYFDA